MARFTDRARNDIKNVSNGRKTEIKLNQNLREEKERDGDLKK